MKTSIPRPALRAGSVSLLALAALCASASTTMADTAIASAPAGPTPVIDTPHDQSASVKIPTAAEPTGAEAMVVSAILSIEITPKPEPKPEPEVETLSNDVDNPVDDAPDTDSTREDADMVEDAQTGDLGEDLLTTARSGIGVPYVWAGSTTSGWDCSGFTSWVYAQHGIELPHSSSTQSTMGTVVTESEAQVGDLVHWPGHVGIYAGDGKVVDAGRSPMSTTERPIWGNPTFTHIEIGDH